MYFWVMLLNGDDFNWTPQLNSCLLADIGLKLNLPKFCNTTIKQILYLYVYTAQEPAHEVVKFWNWGE